MTAAQAIEASGDETAGGEPGPVAYRGRVIIEWPPANGGRPLPGWGTSLYDADSGRQILTCSRVVIAAELTLFADADGNPLLEADRRSSVAGRPAHIGDDGQFRTATFPFYVAEMRVQAGA